MNRLRLLIFLLLLINITIPPKVQVCSSLNKERSYKIRDLRFHQFTSKVFNNTRTLRVLLPSEYEYAANRAKRYPVLYLNDGQNLFDVETSIFSPLEWQVDEAAQTLIIQRKISPLIIVGIDNAGKAFRPNEYLPYEDKFLLPPVPSPKGKRYPEFVINEIMPFINKMYRTRTGPENTGLGGSSYGAVAALYTVMTRPRIFGRLLLESPSIYISDNQLIKDSAKIKVWPQKVYLAIGTKETGQEDGDREAVELAQEMEKSLRKAGLKEDRLLVIIDEEGIHREDAWARRIQKALRFLYGK